MNEKLCIAAWVYGRKYQGWIPIYVYSIKKNYPEYDVKIFVDHKLSLGVKRLLKEFKLWEQVDIYENMLVESTFLNNEIEKRCYRWLINGFGLEKYTYVYWGDIDIYIVKEAVSLKEQHVQQIKKNKMIYDNALRLTLIDYLKNRKDSNKKHLLRLTGLHFIEYENYNKKVYRKQKLILNYLQNKRLKFLDKIFFEDDERCLWLINFISNNSFPKGSYEKSEAVFRPLHGVHFAIGRVYDTYKEILEKNSVRELEHQTYFNMFKNEYNSDEQLRSIVESSPMYIKDIIEMTCKMWRYSLLDDEIISDK